MPQDELTLEQLQALEACVEVATPGWYEDHDGPVSDESNDQPFSEWSPDRISAVASVAVKILFDNYRKTH